MTKTNLFNLNKQELTDYFINIGENLDKLPIEPVYIKKMMNSLIGVLGIMDNNTYKCALVNSLETSVALLNENRKIHCMHDLFRSPKP